MMPADSTLSSDGGSAKGVFIGFPPPLLGAEPQRLPVLAAGAGLLALNLPGGIASDAHPLNPEGTLRVAHALREQLAAGKPELQRMGVETIHSIGYLEPEYSGIALYAVDKEAVDTWRNVFGSRQMVFRYLLLCEPAANLPDELSCDLPIAPHKAGGRMLVSHKTGKRTATHFRRLRSGGGTRGRHNLLPQVELWEAVTDFPRPHQIRLHAFEVGLRVCGEALYDSVPGLFLSDLKGLRQHVPGETPLLSGPAIHLAEVAIPIAAGSAAEFSADKGVPSRCGDASANAANADCDGETADGKASPAVSEGETLRIEAPLPRVLATVWRYLFEPQG